MQEATNELSSYAGVAPGSKTLIMLQMARHVNLIDPTQDSVCWSSFPTRLPTPLRP